MKTVIISKRGVSLLYIKVSRPKVLRKMILTHKVHCFFYTERKKLLLPKHEVKRPPLHRHGVKRSTMQQQAQPVLGTNGWGDDEDEARDRDDDDQHEAFADASLPPDEVCARIETLAVSHVRGVLGDVLPAVPRERRAAAGCPGGKGDRGGDDHGAPPLAAALEFTVAAGRQGAVLVDSVYRVPTSATARVRLHDARRRVFILSAYCIRLRIRTH